jgi:hypothetical protein
MKFRKNKKFSYNAAYRGTEQQRKSTATFISFAKITAGSINSRGRILAPYSNLPANPDYANWKGGVNAGIMGGIGGAATIVLAKRFFFNATLISALGMGLAEYRLEKRNVFVSQPQVGGSLRLSIGYCGDRWMIRSSSIADYYTLGGNILEMSHQLLINTFTISYRLDKQPPPFGLSWFD